MGIGYVAGIQNGYVDCNNRIPGFYAEAAWALCWAQSDTISTDLQAMMRKRKCGVVKALRVVVN